MNTGINPDEEFIKQFRQVQLDSHQINRANGWWNQRWQTLAMLKDKGIDHSPNLAIELIALCHTELTEAVEAARRQRQQSWADAKTKDTMVRELAGTIVRIMDMAEFFELPLADAILEEIKANAQRGYMHGGKKA
jgi:NTP pyrophosphatase (non-canonical NTP hydrolase)